MEQTVKTALLAELLGDVDQLLQRLETLDTQLAGKIEQATTEAAGRAFVQMRLSLERAIEGHRHTLLATGNLAAGEIDQRLRQGASYLSGVSRDVQHGLCRALLYQGVFGLLCGLFGGAVGAWLIMVL